MISPLSQQADDLQLKSAVADEEDPEPFDYGELCPPNCDERSLYNS